jgi:hypothetical protein
MENQVVPSSNAPLVEPRKNSEKIKRILVGVILLLIVAAVSVSAYLYGKRSNGTATEVTPTPMSEEMFATDTPTPETSSASVSGTITPTKKPTVTPKPTLTPTPDIKTKILDSDPELDGFRSSNNGGNNSLEIRAGRNIYLVTRGFVSFDLSDMPSGVTISEATLRLYQNKTIGNPYGVGGELKVDHLTYGDSLDSNDYGLAALSSSFTTLTSNAVKEWKDANVTDMVKDDIANARSLSQYRIHFQIESTGGDATGDFVYFESADNSMGTGNTPQLVIKYY